MRWNSDFIFMYEVELESSLVAAPNSWQALPSAALL
jgi:hypothetical protein